MALEFQTQRDMVINQFTQLREVKFRKTKPTLFMAFVHYSVFLILFEA
jgi:hypothetical protein